MKTMLIGINCKFIHPNVAIRVLKANTSFDVDYKEYTIKDKVERIVKDINSMDCEMVGFSCYIWNIEMMKEIIPQIKNKIIMLGGPEVSYDVNYFFSILPNVSFIISAEGETAFDELLRALHTNKDFTKVRNLSYKNDKGEIISNPILEEDLTKLKSNYHDIDKNQYVYFETSRGCAFKCAYCLSSREKSVRYFDQEMIKENLARLINEGYKIFKFLDRTFNLNKHICLDMIKFIDSVAKPDNVFEFEIAAEILDDTILDYLEQNTHPGRYRFEIGIQSTNDEVVKAVHRYQNFEKLNKIIRRIEDGKLAVLHLDLIAGLPYEGYDSFKNTLNETLKIRPTELQLGFLKLLRGTSLRDMKDFFGYEFDEKAPYEVISNRFISKEELDKIRLVEQVIEKYYNVSYIKYSFNRLLDLNIDNNFDFLLDYGEYFEKRSDWFHYQLADLYEILDEYLKLKEMDYNNMHLNLIYDYLLYAKIRPKRWYEFNTTKEEKSFILKKFMETEKTFSQEEVYKYSQLVKVNEMYLLKMFVKNKEFLYMIDLEGNILSKEL